MGGVGILQRLRESDLRWLIEAAGVGDLSPAELRGNSTRLVALTQHRAVAAALLEERGESFPAVAPALVFLILTSRTLQALEERGFVGEATGRGGGLPVFDAVELRRFAAEPAMRLVLADLPASFAHLESGVRWVRSESGWRRRRYRDLDPLSLAERMSEATGAERSAALRRLGDVALFLAGVFPEHVPTHPIEARRLERIHRLLAAASTRPVDGPGELLLAGGDVRGVWLLEWLGRQAYGLAAEDHDVTGASRLSAVSRRFRTARRTLNAVPAHDLGSLRRRWFPVPDR